MIEEVVDQFSSQKINNSKITGVVFDEETLLHEEHDSEHFENPDRVRKILDHLKKQNLLDSTQENCLEIVEKIQPLDKNLVQDIYNDEYMENFETKWQERIKEEPNSKNFYFDADTYCNQYTVRASYLSAGSNIMAIDKIMKQEWLNSFCIVRPPGHHSGYFAHRPSGFCYLNNVVIAAKYALKQYSEKVKRVMILDWDVHYGDGTAKLVEDNDQILLLSVHQYDKGEFYPGTGSVDEVGQGKGEGFNINVPWNMNFDKEIFARNQEYVYCFERLIAPILKDFNPDLILISSGFDSCQEDLLGDCELDIDGYAYLTKRIQDISNGQVIVNLEGGYNLDEIPKAAEGVLRGLMRQELPVKNSVNGLNQNQVIQQCKPNSVGIEGVQTCLDKIYKYWPIVHTDKQALEFQENIDKKLKLKELIEKLKVSVKTLDVQVMNFDSLMTQEEKNDHDKVIKATWEMINLQNFGTGDIDFIQQKIIDIETVSLQIDLKYMNKEDKQEQQQSQSQQDVSEDKQQEIQI